MPQNGISKIYNKEEVVGEEQGVSCWKAMYRNGRWYPVFPKRPTRFALDDFSWMMQVESEVYLASGTQMENARERLKAFDVEKVFAAVYATKVGARHVDVYCDIVKQPRLFQWNIFNTQQVENAMFDMDGVLCVDPTVDDDGEQYVAEITNAKPLYIPKYTIDTIITCRLEKYRAITEDWLRAHNVSYNNLIMLPFSSKRERLIWGRHGEWKGKYYQARPNALFYESSLVQARKIKAIANKPVFCTEIMNFV